MVTIQLRKKFTLIHLLLLSGIWPAAHLQAESRPNILFCISDDQSYIHTSANGDPVVQTPAFDRVARRLTIHTCFVMHLHVVHPDQPFSLVSLFGVSRKLGISTAHSRKICDLHQSIRKRNGYLVGYTGKGWSPGRLEPGAEHRILLERFSTAIRSRHSKR